MAEMKVTDKSGLSLSFSAALGSGFAKYLRSSVPISMVLSQKQPAAGSVGQLVSAGITFDSPVKLGTTSDELTIQSGLQGSLSLKAGTLFDPDKDDFGDSVKVPQGQAYLSAAITASLEPGLTEKSGDLKFGLDVTSKATLTNYALFNTTEPLKSAVQQVFENFRIPADLEDIDGMKPGAIATVEGNGSIKFSVKGTYPLFSNPLATVATGPLNGSSVKVGGSLSLGVTGALSGGYQVRVQRLDGRKFELGYEKKLGSSFSVTAQAQVAVTSSVGGFDVIAALLKAISKDPVVDKDTFSKQTGLTDAEISTMAAAVKAGIDHSLAASISDEIDLSKENDAAFSYQVDLGALDDSGREAVNDALSGDLSKIESGKLAGITPLRSVLTTTREAKRVFKVNLLGIYNFGSVTDLIRNGRLLVDRDTGTIHIVDKVTATHVGFTADNFAAKPAKLRAMTAAGVTMTAAYQIGGAIPGAADLTCSCWSFEEHQKTAMANLEHYLQEATALGLITAEQARAKLKPLSNVSRHALGASTFLIQSDYNAAAFQGMFLGANGPRLASEYQVIGRNALVALLDPDDPADNARKRALTDAALWDKLARAGSADNIVRTAEEAGMPATTAQAVYGDVDVVLWWSAAMGKMAQAVAELDQFLKSNPKPDPENNTLKKLRASLNDAMASVASDVRDRFGEPWGLLVMAEASGRKDSTTVNIVSARLALTASVGAPKLPDLAAHA